MTDQEIIEWLKNKGKRYGNTLFYEVAERFTELVKKVKENE